MKISLDNGTAEYRITAYESGSVKINDKIIVNPIIVSPEKIEPWDIDSMDSLAENHLQKLLEYDPEILILGTGSRQCFPPPDLMRPVIQAGIGLEVMDTAAACRTYNILMTENRAVVVALLMID